MNFSSVSTLSVKLLVKAVSNVTDWHSLGLQLDLTMSQLRNIESTYHKDGIERVKAEMFHVWLKSYPNASWTDLITALKAMDENGVANEIEEAHYGKSYVTGDHGDANWLHYTVHCS